MTSHRPPTLTNRRAAWLLLAAVAGFWLVFAIGILHGQFVWTPPAGVPQIWVTFSGGTPAAPGVMTNAALDPQHFQLTPQAFGVAPVLSVIGAGGVARNRIDYPRPAAATLELPAEATEATVEVYKNGGLGRENEDYTRAGRTLTLQPVPQPDDFFTVFWY